jgi:hypothetical protein
LGGLHRGLVADAEGAADGWPGVTCGAGFCDEFGAACGHGIHPRLEGGEGFEDVVGHTLTVTGVAGCSQACNYGCRQDEGAENMDEGINITNGDTFTVEPHYDGEPGIKIQNAVWVEEPRWLDISVAGKHDRETAINNLIYALECLRDGKAMR